jgi:hypothetical protein
MKLLNAFQHGDGAHWGLSDWYQDGEAELAVALAEKVPFDTGWYSSKKEIASARIRSEDGIKIKVEVSVSDDFDTEGNGYASTQEWTLDAVSAAVSKAWANAESARDDNQEYEGFRVGREGRWEETFLVNIGWGENLSPPGDCYHNWGWQFEGEDDCMGKPHPDIPIETVSAFEKWAHNWCFGHTVEGKSLTIGEWTITPWRDNRPLPEDPNDYAGMGWVGRDGRP